jgi:hypothetical protein
MCKLVTFLKIFKEVFYLFCNIFDKFFAADYDSVLEFLPERQDFEIIELLSVKNGIYCNI